VAKWLLEKHQTFVKPFTGNDHVSNFNALVALACIVFVGVSFMILPLFSGLAKLAYRVTGQGIKKANLFIELSQKRKRQAMPMKMTTKRSHLASITRKWPKNSSMAASMLSALETLPSFEELLLSLTTVYLLSLVFMFSKYIQKKIKYDFEIWFLYSSPSISMFQKFIQKRAISRMSPSVESSSWDCFQRL
jgi:predicted PurR-regulated permease PerM